MLVRMVPCRISRSLIYTVAPWSPPPRIPALFLAAAAPPFVGLIRYMKKIIIAPVTAQLDPLLSDKVSAGGG